MNISIRLEQPGDCRSVEDLTREAFWGCTDHPTCDGEHLLVHKLRSLPCLVPELNFVAEADGELAGHVIYSMAKIVTTDGCEIPVLNFGPLSVLPKFKRTGVGSALMRHSIERAKSLGYRAIVFYGHPDYYPRFGFNRASAFGIITSDGKSYDALMAMPLYDGALDGVSGRYIEDAAYSLDEREIAEFEKTFPAKEPAVLPPIELLTDHLPESARRAFVANKILYVSQLQRHSGVEMLGWEGIDENAMEQINCVLSELGQPTKLLPHSPILQLAQMNVRIPSVRKIREKAGISVYQVESEGERYILKVLANPEDRREIDNYKLLASMGIPTLPMLRHTECALLLPDLAHDTCYRLGSEDDMSDPAVLTALAKWYKDLHSKGCGYILKGAPALYDETDIITLSNLQLAAAKTGTQANRLWSIISDRFDEIRSRIDALARTLTYNDFHWTNLAVARDKSAAMMFDYNLLGKGYAYGDVRNVICWLSGEALGAFLREYGAENIREDERAADPFLSSLTGLLIAACNAESFPGWAEPNLADLKSGSMLDSLALWLGESDK